MSLISKMMAKWDRKKARKHLSQAFVHCVVCGKELKTSFQRFLMINHQNNTVDLPTCTPCQVKLVKAEATDAESLRVLKKK